jgi:hypothetical protein
VVEVELLQSLPLVSMEALVASVVQSPAHHAAVARLLVMVDSWMELEESVWYWLLFGQNQGETAPEWGSVSE